MYTAASWRPHDNRVVHVFGWLFADGRVERSITADIDGEAMSTADARQLTAALIDGRRARPTMQLAVST